MLELRRDAVIAGTLRLVRPLASGGMGVVWVARHLRLDTEVAVKLIRPDRVAGGPALLRRFEREAKAAARISHPNVVRVMDYGVVDDAVPYIVMELLQGFSLAELLERGGRLSLGTAKSLVHQIGSALESAHEQQIVHRDIKPHNVFATEGSRDHPLVIKVLDFGVAKVLGDKQVPGGGAALTETGMVIGSPPYMSPEQIEGRDDVDLRTDLWSLGVIVYESLTGERPFTGGSFVKVGAAVLDGKYRPVSELRPALPPEVDAWFAKALCPDADERFQSAPELMAAFAALDEPLGEDLPDLLALRPAELATTVNAAKLDAGDQSDTIAEDDGAVPTEVDAVTADAEDVTASHAPVAKKPASERLPATASRRRTWRRRLLLVTTVALLLGAGSWLTGSMLPSTEVDCPPGMVRIKGATFSMGSEEGPDTPIEETPEHDATVETFCLDRAEVTVADYDACSSCSPAPRTVELKEMTPRTREYQNQFCNGPDKPDHPINCIDWNQAKAFCSAQGKRLPTEPEWELAARGTGGRKYPWGDEPPTGDRLNACGLECGKMLAERRAVMGQGPLAELMYSQDDTAPSTAAVASYPAAPEGVFDLAGNVWEWTASLACNYGNADCSQQYERVFRGGAWDTVKATDVRAAKRFASSPTARVRSVGFRCAKSL